MKKTLLIVCMLAAGMVASAQHQINSFFDAKGAVRLETQELDRAADTLVSIFHRTDDVVWSRVVYRIIDMRYKQNYQLYFPTNPEDPQYKSLFQVMLEAMSNAEKPLKVYDLQTEGNIKPFFSDELIMDPSLISERTLYGEKSGSAMSLEEYEEYGLAETSGITYQDYLKGFSSKSLLHQDPLDSTRVSFTKNAGFTAFVKNQYKFLIQEVVFFDKHYSRLFSKIIAIAPLYAPLGLEEMQADEIADEPMCMALPRQLMWWVPFDEFRKYMAKQYMIPQSNDTKRVTFEEFFGKKLYSSYIIGDSNMYDRMFTCYATTEAQVKREQERVATELLNFEQDLWEY